MQIHAGWDFGTLHFCFIFVFNSSLHETMKIGPTGTNQYCYWPVVEIRTGIEE